MNSRLFKSKQSLREETLDYPQQLPAEMLACILSFLGYLDLNKAMGVNKTWHQLIKDSLLHSRAEAFIDQELNRCDIVRITSIPEKLCGLPIKANAAYVRFEDKLVYVNKISNAFVYIHPAHILAFEKILRPATTARTLSESELNEIAIIMGCDTHREEQNGGYLKQIKQFVSSDFNAVQKVANKLFYLKSEKNRFFQETKDIKTDALKSMAKGIGYSSLLPLALFLLVCVHSFLKSNDTGENLIDSIGSSLYALAKCPQSVRYKEYVCEPYLVIPLLLILLAAFLGWLYALGQKIARERYRGPYQGLTSNTVTTAQTEIEYGSANGETIPLPCLRLG